MTTQLLDLPGNTASYSADIEDAHYDDAVRREIQRGRGVGVMFLSFFGTLWLAGGCWNASGNAMVVALIGMLGLAMFWAGRRVSRTTTPGTMPGDRAVAFLQLQLERARVFRQVNIVQWLAIAAFVVALNVVGHPEWITASIILVVGLHFLPLARLFHSPASAATGITLTLVAVSYPFLFAAGPSSPIGPIVTGLVLWTNAAYALSNK